MDVLLVEANSTLKSTSTCRFKNVYGLTHLTRQPEGFGLWIVDSGMNQLLSQNIDDMTLKIGLKLFSFRWKSRTIF